MTESCPTCLHNTLDRFHESNLFLCGNCDALFKADSLNVSQSPGPDTQTDTLESGVVALADPKEEFQENTPFAVSGVALPVNQKVRGGQGVDHFYPESVLEESAELLEGQPIVSGYHQIDGMPDPEHVVGQVTDAGFQEGVGLVFSGEVLDPEVADKISQDYLSVSPTVARELGEYDESMGAQRVKRVGGFRDLAIVVSGQPGAEISMGSNQAATALSNHRIEDGFDVLADDPTTPTDTAPKAVEMRQKVLDSLERRGLEDHAEKERAKLTTHETDTTMTMNTTGSEPDSLSAEERRDVKLKLRKADSFEGRGMEERADTLRSEAADIAGVGSHEEIEVDTL